MLFFDPLYLLFLAPAMLIAIIAQVRVKSAYARASQKRASSGMTGHDAARRILDQAGLHRVGIEPAQGRLSDHYDPRRKVLRLSREVYAGSSLASLGIAAHEAGHALQDAKGYGPLAIRNAIVPLAGFGSNAAFLIFFAGLILGAASPLGQWVMWAGVLLFAAVVVFQLVNLPVEFDASARAKRILVETGMIRAGAEQQEVSRVLGAAAMTYVAATLTAIATLLYLILRVQSSR